MTLETLLPFLLGGSLLGGLLLTTFLMALVSSKKAFFVASLGLAVSVSLNLFYGVANYYTGVGINEAALFHINKGIDGLTQDLLLPLLLLLGMIAIGFLGFLLLAWMRMKKRKTYSSQRSKVIALSATALAVFLSPGLLQPLSLAKTILNQEEYRADLATFTKDVRPEQSTKPKLTQKVVFIYAEGLELAFLDEKRFPKLTPNLNDLRASAMEFTGIHQAPFTGWTIAGQVATQCGHSVGNGQNADGQEHLACLGDLFLEQGFSLSYLNSSHLSFAGKGEFWRAHGYNRQLGYQEISDLAGTPGAPKSEWGPYDDTLLQAARNEYQRLEKDGRPFVLTLLTVDTHANKGHPTPACKHLPHPYEGNLKEKSLLLKSVHCSDLLIGDFVRFLLNQNDPELMIVLLSDHIQPKSNDAQEFLPRNTDRENLLLIWSPSLQPGVNDRRASPFDVYPTVAEAAGLGITSGGLGRSLLQPAPTAVEHFGKQAFFDRIRSSYTLSADGFWQTAKSTTSPQPSN